MGLAAQREFLIYESLIVVGLELKPWREKFRNEVLYLKRST